MKSDFRNVALEGYATSHTMHSLGAVGSPTLAVARALVLGVPEPWEDLKSMTSNFGL